MAAHERDEGSPRREFKPLSVTISHKEDSLDSLRFWNRSEKKLWTVSMFLGCSALYASRTVMPLCIVKVAEELSWDKSESGMVLSAFFWGYMMTQVMGGYLSDKLGGQNVICAVGVFWSLLTFWTPYLCYIFNDKTTTIRLVVLSRVLLGCFQGMHYPSVASMVSKKVSETERTFVYSSISAGSHAGTLFCGSVGSLVMDRFGWQYVFYLVGLLGMAWLIFLRFFLIARDRRKRTIISVKENFVAANSKVTPSKSVAAPYHTLFTTAAFWSMLIAHVCQNNAFFILLSWLPTYFHENFRNAKGWVFNVVPWAVCIPSTIIGGLLADALISKGFTVTVVRKIMNTATLLGIAVSLSLISYVTEFQGALLCMAMAMVFSGFHNSGVLVNPQDIAPTYAGSVFGVMNMAGAVPGFVGVYVAGHILEATKSWSAVFNQTATICVFGWVIYTVFGTAKKLI